MAVVEAIIMGVVEGISDSLTEKCAPTCKCVVARERIYYEEIKNYEIPVLIRECTYTVVVKSHFVGKSFSGTCRESKPIKPTVPRLDIRPRPPVKGKKK